MAAHIIRFFLAPSVTLFQFSIRRNPCILPSNINFIKIRAEQKKNWKSQSTVCCVCVCVCQHERTSRCSLPACICFGLNTTDAIDWLNWSCAAGCLPSWFYCVCWIFSEIHTSRDRRRRRRRGANTRCQQRNAMSLRCNIYFSHVAEPHSSTISSGRLGQACATATTYFYSYFFFFRWKYIYFCTVGVFLRCSFPAERKIESARGGCVSVSEF